MLEAILGNLINLDDLAAKTGLPADQLQGLVTGLKDKAAAGELNLSSVMEAAQASGISMDQIQSMLGAFGGAAGVHEALSGFLDKDGDGNPLNDLGGLAKGLFG